MLLEELKSNEANGAKHKSKAAEKEAASADDNVSTKDASKTGKSADGKKQKKERVVLKDANGNDLKRPLTAYMLYNNFRRPILKEEHPGKFTRNNLRVFADLSLTDLSKLIGQEWKQLTEAVKKVMSPF